MRSAYPGNPLELDQIRLIRLMPGRWRDPVICDLYNTRQFTSRNELVHYYALSYVWGSRGSFGSVQLAGQAHRTTINLERALRYIRVHYPHGVELWVDALCIDQDNVFERTHQVELMSLIYSRCQKVLVYLGDRLDERQRSHRLLSVKRFGSNELHSPNDMVSAGKISKYDSSRAFALIEGLSRDKHIPQLDAVEVPQMKDDLGEQQPPDAKQHTDHAFNDESCAFESLRRLMHSPLTPWWTRVWVIQEAALAPSIDIIHGSMTAPWSMFVDAAKNYLKHSGECCLRIIPRLPRDQVKVLDDFCKRVLDIADLRVNTEPKPLLDLLRRFRDRDASDPRDKVFALLSLASTQLIPDYSMSEADVFAQATLECIMTSGCLDVLNTDLGRKYRTDLPSWVPDWSAVTTQTNDNRARTINLYHSVRGEIAMKSVRTTKGVLTLSGTHLGRIYEVGEVMWSDAEGTVRSVIENWWNLYCSRRGLDRLRSSNIQRGLFWRLICADIICEPQSQPPRRTQPDDELTFALWAMVSPKSPFRVATPAVDKIWSTHALAWQTLVLVWPDVPVFVQGAEFDRENLVPRLQGQYQWLIYKINNLLEYAGLQYSIRHFFRNKEPIEIAPWEELLFAVRDKLYTSYTSNIDLNPISRERLIPTVDRSIMTATLSRRLLKIDSIHTFDSVYGLGPVDTRSDDQVCVLVGGKTPFVLRSFEFFSTVCSNTEHLYSIRHDIERVVECVGKECVYRIISGQSADGQLVGDCYVEDWKILPLRASGLCHISLT